MLHPRTLKNETAAGIGGRLLSLDVLRGLIVAGMILVTDPGSYSTTYAPLLHAEWQGSTPTDMIFPAFLVMVGVATTLSLRKRLESGASSGDLLLRVLRRAVTLIVLGVLLNAVQQNFDWAHLRLPGILQRIALCYAMAALIYISLRGTLGRAPASVRRTVIGTTAVAVAVLVSYWLLLKQVNVPGFGAGRLDSYGSLPAYLDRRVFSVAHLWPYGLTPGVGVTFDPEGLLSTLGALVTTLGGVAAGAWLQTQRPRARQAAEIAAAGAVLVFVGYLLGHTAAVGMPMIKKIWTPTFALFSTGVPLLLLGAAIWVIDLREWRRGVAPLLILGTNAIAAFAISTILTSVLAAVQVREGAAMVPLHEHLDHLLLTPWLPAKLASLVYALCIVALNVALVWPLYRKRWFLRL